MSVYRNPNLDAIPHYVAGKPAEELARERGITDVIKLASNENPLGPSPRAIQVLREAAARAHIYPDDHCRDLAAAVAAHLGVDQDWLLFGTGSDDAMHLAVWAFGRPGSVALCPDPGFLGYPIFARSFGLIPEAVTLPGRAWDMEAFARRASLGDVGAVFLASPNNPTGTGLRHADLVAFLRDLSPDILVILDMAYREFDPDPDAPDEIELVRAFDNVIAARTFSKAYGLAGLRIGYAVARPERIAQMKKLRTPFAANGAALAAALEALEDTGHLSRSIALAREGVAWWTRELVARGVAVVPSRANFVMAEFEADATEIYEGLLARGVIVRHLRSFGLPHALRITAGTEQENARALAALDEVLAG